MCCLPLNSSVGMEVPYKTCDCDDFGIVSVISQRHLYISKPSGSVVSNKSFNSLTVNIRLALPGIV